MFTLGGGHFGEGVEHHGHALVGGEEGLVFVDEVPVQRVPDFAPIAFFVVRHFENVGGA